MYGCVVLSRLMGVCEGGPQVVWNVILLLTMFIASLVTNTVGRVTLFLQC